ncbi:inositol polyphosphate-5-phosphatase A-like isoform X1 [Macrosteles quadrilineatus]|uniref:inositol polyphosphate-5-phosphatase A-like isoform X1 n=2 Tax=Macrosteles quadrilineatus TaxID=74068 RepID=UPI0023E2C3D9|nr:inositol polyphosphate-5-phosphatase A-like isoform X1 [Macrosteles quadrilineatus]
MAEKTTPALFITANVGSIFEEPNVMLKLWTEEFLSTVARLEPKFLALHCQEVGGKNYEQSMKHVEYFVRLLMTSEELRLFDRVRVYLDEDYSSAENFTALGNFYFIHESVPDVLIWDFKELNFVAVEGKDVHSGNIEDVQTKEKSKFPQDFFPECKWSRKGFLRTRWNLNGTIFDLVNIHLFHDASNFVAMETFPSVYSKTRQRALEYTLDRFHTDQYGSAPFFLFGDFNFRTDMKGVIKKLANGLNPVEVNSTKNNEINKLLFRDEEQVILTLGKKEFSHYDHQNLFIKNAGEWLKEFDNELGCFAGQLFEFPIQFPPSYPYEEDTHSGRQYMQTRCPSWCDRVVLSETAKLLVHQIDDEKSIEYGSIGEETCMGDHKPVFLRLSIVGEAGRVVCCDNRPPLHVTPSLVEPSVAARLLERTDSSNSIQIIETHLDFVKPVNDTIDDAFVDFPIRLENMDTLLDFTKDKREKLSFSRLSSEGNIGVDFDPVKAPFRPLPQVEEPKVYDRYIVKRVQSASFVEVPRVGMLRQGGCRCMSESQSWRARSVSISSRTTNNWRSNSRVRLISDSNLQNSLLRLQSHHSSSDEEWFEEVSNDENNEDSGLNKSDNSPNSEMTESKIPVLEEISLEEPYEPIQSVEDISGGRIPLELKTELKCKSCCPIRCRKKRRLTKSQRNSIKSNISGNKDSLDNASIGNDRCCSIS